MSAVLKPSGDRQNRARKVAAVLKNDLPRTSGRVAPQSVQTAVRRLPSPDAPPKWLRSLIKLQQASLIATFTLSGLTLVIYAWTVYSQQLWGKEFDHLAKLRRDERQLGANSAMLQNQIANQATRPGTTLVPRTPDSMIFLKPAPVRNAPPVAPAPQSLPVAPLGY
jgi:hypothetical protein